MPDQNARAELIHRVFTGVHNDNYDLVADTLAEFEVNATQVGYSQGHLRGFVVGLVFGAIIGVMIAGLPDCDHSRSDGSSAANAAARGSTSGSAGGLAGAFGVTTRSTTSGCFWTPASGTKVGAADD